MSSSLQNYYKKLLTNLKLYSIIKQTISRFVLLYQKGGYHEARRKVNAVERKNSERGGRSVCSKGI